MSNKIKVDLGNNSYNISLIEGFKNSVLKFASSTKSQCMLITQKEILSLYKDEINELSNLPNVNIFLIDQGEEAKSFESISLIVNEMAKKHFDRSSLVFAVGGGVVGDVAGFASSIFMRGIKYIQYPTTLLGMVDSAIGGKTGINLQNGKTLSSLSDLDKFFFAFFPSALSNSLINSNSLLEFMIGKLIFFKDGMYMTYFINYHA